MEFIQIANFFLALFVAVMVYSKYYSRPDNKKDEK